MFKNEEIWFQREELEMLFFHQPMYSDFIIYASRFLTFWKSKMFFFLFIFPFHFSRFESNFIYRNKIIKMFVQTFKQYFTDSFHLSHHFMIKSPTILFCISSISTWWYNQILQRWWQRWHFVFCCSTIVSFWYQLFTQKRC